MSSNAEPLYLGPDCSGRGTAATERDLATARRAAVLLAEEDGGLEDEATDVGVL